MHNMQRKYKRLVNVNECVLEQFTLSTKIIIGGDVFSSMLEKRKSIFMVTDKFTHESGRTSYLTDHITKDARYLIFSDVTPDGVSKIVDFKTDMVVALGRGSPIDAAPVILQILNNNHCMSGICIYNIYDYINIIKIVIIKVTK